MLVSAVFVELVIAVESLPTKPTLGMPPESALIYGPRIVIPESLMFP
jgi:hypothetical protein